MSEGAPELVDKANSGLEETVFVVRAFGPDGPQPPASGECLKESVTGVGGVSHNLTFTLYGPRVVQVLEGWKIAADHFLSRSNDTLQSALVLGSGSSEPDGDRRGEDGLDDGSVEVRHHCLWQVYFLQLPQEVHPLLGFLDEVLGDGSSREAKRLHCVDCGVTEGDGGRC